MEKRYLYRLVFKEDFMNNMLDKGWMPIQFNRLGYCIFKRCEQAKYRCKLILIDDECKMSINELTKLTKSIQSISTISVKIFPYRNRKYKIDLYYIIYSGEKILELEGRGDISNFKTYYTNKSLKVMIFEITLEVFRVICYTGVFLLLLERTVYYWQYVLICSVVFIGFIVGSNTIINRIRELQMIKCIYSLMGKNS